MKHSVYYSAFGLVAVTLWLCGAAAAQAPQGGEPPHDPNAPRPVRVSFLQAALDKNKDGELSKEEIAAAPTSLLLLDKNKDGKLTGEELRPAPPPVGPTVAEMVARLMEFDGDGNGTLSKDELPDQLAGIFAQADADKNKVLTGAELTALVEKQEAEAKARAASRPAPPVPPRQGGRPMRVPPLQAALDANGDGEITKEELANAGLSLLVLDKDKDGKVSVEELRPAPPPGEEPKPGGPPAPPTL